MTAKQSIAELSADAAVLISKFSAKEKGDTIGYDEIQKWIGWDIRENRGIMVTVKNRLLRDYGKVLDVISKVGYRVLTDEQTAIGKLRSDRERRRRSALGSKAKAGTVELSNLNDTQRITYLAEVTAAHVTAEASADKSVKQLGSTLNGSSTPLALNMALDAIKKNLG